MVDARDVQAGAAAVAGVIADVPRRLWIHNKIDLLPAPPRDTDPEVVAVSAATGHGLPALHARLRELAGQGAGEGSEGEFTARARHVDALRRAGGHVEQAKGELSHEMLELAAEELRLAHDALGEVTGRISADEMLGYIFSTFCIGK